MRLGDDPRVAAVMRASARYGALEHHREIGSTNDVALRAVHEGGPVGLVVAADRQTAGRGRRGRQWIDAVDGPTGPANLAVTVTVPAPAARVGVVPLVAGLAVADAYEHAGAVPTLKWPNDVLLATRKAAGILVERHTTSAGDVLLIGCGLDLDWRGVVRDERSRSWTSLAEALGGDVDRGAVLAALLHSLDTNLDLLADDPTVLLAAYRRRCVTIGSGVRTALPGGVVLSGRATGVDDEGRLLLDTGDGPVRVAAGEVTHVRDG